MQEITNQNIQEAKIKMLNKKHSAFILNMLYKLQINASTEVKTVELCTSEALNQILLNEDWFNGYSPDERTAILAHEVMHYSLQHDLRMGQRDAQMYQQACDHVVNNMLIDMGFTLPERELNFTKEKYRNMAVEAVYKDIEQEQQDKKDQNQNSNGNGSNGNTLGQGSSLGNDVKPNNSPSNIEQNQRNQEVLDADMANQAQGNKIAGEGNEAINTLFKDITEGTLDWKTILHAYVDEITRGDMSYIHLNRRYIPFELYMPDNKSENFIENIAVAFDVSGSVTKKEAHAFLRELKLIRDNLEPETISVTTFNSNIVEQFEIKKEDPLDEVNIDIGGGTALTPVFKLYNKKTVKPAFLIVFSDLEVYDFPEKPPTYPVIWICINNKSANPPFGKLIHITSKELTKNDATI